MTQPTAAHHPITYSVNGESETTSQEELTVATVLETAGFTPVSDYTLNSKNPKEEYGTDYQRLVKIHPNQRFEALYIKPTPTS